MKTVRWYFDYISPYAYLQSAVLSRFERYARIEPRPVLFAGLLNHFGQKGPAEIPAKKAQTFREVVWLAHQHQIPLKLPHAHPFNPLPLLRLSIALGNDADVVQALFRHVWVDGHLPSDEAPWAALCGRLGVDDPDAEVARADVKDALRRNTEEAIELGVFGVPTIVVDGELFWGQDSLGHVERFLRGEDAITPEVRAMWAEVPIGIVRPGAATR